MLWLVDYVWQKLQVLDMATKAWVLDQGYLTTSFIDRGDQANYDWTKADFTTNWAWHDLDLSAIVPAGAKAVALSLRIKSTDVMSQVFFKTKGFLGERNCSCSMTQVADIGIYADLIVHPDTNRKIQYRISNVTWYYINLTVKGWWL